MTVEEKAAMKDWVENWKRVGPILEELRLKDIHEGNLENSIRAFDLAFRSALWLHPAEPTSGLIEFHRILAKSR